MSDSPKMTNATMDVLDAMLTSTGKLYGLKIAQATKLMTGTVYPILARLEKAGWVASAWEDDEGPDVRGSRRRFYQLTPMGRELSKAALDARAERTSKHTRIDPHTGLA